uniref:Peroxiredoxin n=1 Tax=Thermodesulfobium narugense TaxID=184064 RepID=A0A7C5KDP7_9BACT
MSFPLLGEKIENKKVKTTHGLINLPDDYSGKWVVLFSHPADFTPVCTTEFVAFQKKLDDFKALNTELIGLSIDQVFSHIKWIEWIKEKLGVSIEFPIIADDMGDVAKSFGMIQPAKGTNTVRAVFVIDDKGVLRLILYYPQELGRNIDEILRAVRALQVSDKNKVAIPANWPENDLVGRDVIVPPPSDVSGAAERSGEADCFDWWFCHKSLK